MKKRITLLLAISLIAFMSLGCDPCVEDVTGIDGTTAAKLYYPCRILKPIPATTMSSGWLAGLYTVEWISEAIAQKGYVVLAFTPANRAGLVTVWEDAHKNTFRKLKEINRSHATLAGKIDESKLQITGYSKGGGGSLAAAADLGDEVASVLTFAPYWGEEYPLDSLRSMKAAVFITAGGDADILATPAMTRKQFDAMPGTISKLYRRHDSWGHLAWLGGSEKDETILNEIAAWMNYYLKENQSGESILSDRTDIGDYEWIK